MAIPPSPFNINYASGAWQCHPERQTLPKSLGARFRNDSTSACKVCFARDTVFGVKSITIGPKEECGLTFEGPVGDGTGFHVADAGGDCVPPADGGDPYDVTIGSGEGKEMKAGRY